MKRKGLTIIFFSMTVLAVTPRVMHHLNNYVAAAQNQAQVHLLNFLLSYGAPAEEADAASQKAQAVFTEQVASDALNETNKARRGTPSPSKSAVAQNLMSKRASRKSVPANFSETAGLSLEHSRLIAPAEQHYTFQLDQQANLTAPEMIQVKAETLKSMRWVGDKKALLALQKEFDVLVKAVNVRPRARRAPVMRASMEREVVPSFETEAAPPAQKVEDCSSKLSSSEF